MDLASPFRQRLKQARLAKGFSQKELGILAGIDEFSASARMNQYEKGVHTPDYSIAQRIAEQLQVPVAWLYCNDDELADAILAFYLSPTSLRQEWMVMSSKNLTAVAEPPQDYDT